MKCRTAFLFALIVFFACLSAAQQPTIKRVPMHRTSPTSGQEMFMAYCASCHGTDAKGNGPAVPALKVPPPDLTTLAAHNGGKFPSDHVANVIRSGSDLPAHGSKDMPVWGPLFSSLNRYHEAEVTQRVANLTHYIESLQVK